MTKRDPGGGFGDVSRGSLGYEGRRVAGGHRTVSGIHYEETYAPTFRHDTFRVFLFMAAQMNNLVMQADAVSAYLAARVHLGVLQGSEIY